jgi:phosphoribosylanthranilate isomerase
MTPGDQPMFHVKICGITSAADARLVADAGADAIGLNFVAGSPRALAPAAAREVVVGVPRGVLRVGVFAGGSAAEILAVVRVVGLDAVQLHGHLAADRSARVAGPSDPPARCAELEGVPVIRAARLAAGPPEAALDPVRRWIADAVAAGRGPALVLVDAAVVPTAMAGVLGGTGHTVDWGALARAGSLPVRMALAGGLTPTNVAAAIRATGLRAVDTASGVESSPGRKDPEKVRDFVAAARVALGLS